MSPLPWLLIIPLLHSAPAEIALVGVGGYSLPLEFEEPEFSERRLLGVGDRGVSEDGTREVKSIPWQYSPQGSSAHESRILSRWGWSLGQNLVSQPQALEDWPQPFGREALVEHLLETSQLFQLRKLPIDAVFQPLGIDPLLHAPPWWVNEPVENQNLVFSFWAREVPSEQVDGLLRAGLGLTLEVGGGASWDCRFTTNIDQQGEAGILLQFCWY